MARTSNAAIASLWVANTKSAIAATEGRRNVLVVAIDIEERMAVERALGDAEEANVAKSTFIANMSRACGHAPTAPTSRSWCSRPWT